MATLPEASSNQMNYARDGFLLVKGLIPPEEVAEIKARFEEIWTKGVPGWFEQHGEGSYQNNLGEDYPRVVHPHRFDELSRRYLIDPRILDVVGELLADEPIAAQTMFYWKPPGTLGQALHQDNLYLQAEDAEGCMASWLAIDECNEENGCLVVVPGSNGLDVQCPTTADSSVSFSSNYVAAPDGFAEMAVVMEPGDCLFFGGHTIHGSGPNRSPDRCRRAFINHYIGARSTTSAGFYNPLIRRDGVEFDNDSPILGNPCGVAFDKAH
jgi:ectoine hydroxylase-related dioxygenase (phytanoyl-CoA dioxygenase family)